MKYLMNEPHAFPKSFTLTVDHYDVNGMVLRHEPTVYYRDDEGSSLLDPIECGGYVYYVNAEGKDAFHFGKNEFGTFAEMCECDARNLYQESDFITCTSLICKEFIEMPKVILSDLVTKLGASVSD